MTTEPDGMREIHDIRLDIYEEIKGMTDEEKVEFFHNEAGKAIKEYGLTPSPLLALAKTSLR